jgi:hypothetical protein
MSKSPRQTVAASARLVGVVEFRNGLGTLRT